MVANWEILNNEFDKTLESLSDKDWDNWHNKIETQKKMHRLTLLLSAQIQEAKLSRSQQTGNFVFNEIVPSTFNQDFNDLVSSLELDVFCNDSGLPLAA